MSDAVSSQTIDKSVYPMQVENSLKFQKCPNQFSTEWCIQTFVQAIIV